MRRVVSCSQVLALVVQVSRAMVASHHPVDLTAVSSHPFVRSAMKMVPTAARSSISVMKQVSARRSR